MTLPVALAGFALAGLAAAWPHLQKARPLWPSVPADDIPDRSGWVNRLFVLAAQSDASGSAEVATAARALIAALVAPKRG